jgi:hypothetical protein
MAEQHWFNAGEIKPRDISPNPRCPDCQTGGMKHPAHPGRRCGLRIDGVECDCEDRPKNKVT